jgi:Domain of unknown function (DUF4349)
MKSIYFLLFTFLLFACQNGREAKEQNISMMELNLPDKMAAVTDEAEVETKESIDPNRKLIKNGSLEFETLDLEKTSKSVKSKIWALKGYISTETDSKEEYRHEKRITVRIPAANFDTFMSKINEDVQEYDRKEINIEDVTDQFVDIQARLKNKKQVEEKYIQLLKKGVSVADILKIEEQIGEIRGEIESVEGRLKLMENQVNYSTLHISFYKLKASKFNFWFRFQSAFNAGWDNLLGFIIAVFNLWPFGIIIGIVIWALRKWRKKRKELK